VHVIHAGPNVPRALVYLHGVCGDPKAPRAWQAAAARHVTLISMLGDTPCEERPGRFRWTATAEALEVRIARAVGAVQAARGGRLEREGLVLAGYSQGALWAERLVAAFPDRYPWVLLGGAPRRPNVQVLAKSRAIAILGGEYEDTRFMQSAAAELTRRGTRAEFFLLRRAAHGQYGPEAEPQLEAVLRWLLEPS
jgi:predicted esterase